MPETDESLPRLLGDRYRLEATIGHGGMGIVYRATDLTMHRPVAVKLIRGTDGIELDEEVAGRFLREAKNTARIQHEHIIEVFDLGRSHEGDLFFVMELLEGESLSTRIRRLGKIAPDVVAHIGRQICEALHVAHSAGIIHRDLKPANVMLIPRAGDDNYVKVLDFGVAKSYSSDQQTQLTHTGMLVGTVEYMAPEQIMGRTVDGRTDVYSLGVVLYRMLTGRPPFRDGGVPSLIHAHLNLFPKPIREVEPDVPAALEEVVMRALAKDPSHRYASMAELARALGQQGGGEAGLVSLEYGDDDPYEAGDQTELVRPAAENPEFDDATVKMERRTPASGASGVSGVSGLAGRKGGAGAAAPSAMKGGAAPAEDLAEFSDRTAVMSRDDSTAKRMNPLAVSKEPRTCAMCQTRNPPHVRACVACGVSLATEDQDAVRARVAAPRAGGPAPIPPPVSGAYRAGVPPAGTPASGTHPPYTPSHGVPYGAPSAPPPSMWQRFLSWTGLRTR
jgi:tRNA A-37 threonylcarbamoyl transferase component Bud32